MLAEFENDLKTCKIILASKSPRRQEILKDNLKLDFEVVSSDFAEDILKSSCDTPEEYVMRTCFMKSCDVIQKLQIVQNIFQIIISSDTIVVHDNNILEKPSSYDEAFEMLKKLSGSKHKVLTAVTLAISNISSIHKNIPGFDTEISGYRMKTFFESTDVEFHSLSDLTISAYISTGEPFDKAGGYGIQSLGSSFVRGIQGCYFNVMGFPVSKFCLEFIPFLIELKQINGKEKDNNIVTI